MQKNYGEVIKSLREKENLSQKDLANILNKSQRAISHYEKGDSQPDINDLIKLAELFKVPVDVIVGRYEIPDKE